MKRQRALQAWTYRADLPGTKTRPEASWWWYFVVQGPQRSDKKSDVVGTLTNIAGTDRSRWSNIL